MPGWHKVVQSLVTVQGGDLMGAIANDRQNKLCWSRKGHTLALDIARGLVHLHANKVSTHKACYKQLCVLQG